MTGLLIKLFVNNRRDTQSAQVRGRYAQLANITGILANILLCGTKLFVGMAAGSVAVITDAFNNLSDAATNVLTLLGFVFSRKNADKQHPHGHGRMEYLIALIVNILIVMVGVELLRSSVEKIRDPGDVHMSTVFLVLLALSAAVKLWLFFFYRKIGRLIRSPAIRITAFDSLADVLATSVVLASAVIARYADIHLDGWAGLLVAGFILFAGIKALKEPMDLLLGKEPSPEFVAEMEQFIQKYPDILRIHDFIVHDYGPTRLVVTFHAEIDADTSLIHAHQIIDRVEKDLQEAFDCQVTVHPDPVPIRK